MWSVIVVAGLVMLSPVAGSQVTPAQVSTLLELAGVSEIVDPLALDDLTALVADAQRAGILGPIDTRVTRDDRVDQTSAFWGAVGPEWRDVASRQVVDLLNCRQQVLAIDDGSCRASLEQRLWLDHAERLRSTIVMRLSMAESLGSVDRERVSTALLTVRDRAVERMRLIVEEPISADQYLALEVGSVLAGIAADSERADP